MNGHATAAIDGTKMGATELDAHAESRPGCGRKPNGPGLGLTRAAGEIRLRQVGGYSSMVESKLVELVVAGSSPVGHPNFDK